MRTNHAEMRLDLLLSSFLRMFFLGAPSPAERLSHSCVCSCINSGQVENPDFSIHHENG